MKIVAAPNAFKGSMSGYEAARAIKQGVHRLSQQIEVACVPVADGGDGLVDILCQALGGTIEEAEVRDPRNHKILSTYCYLKKSRTVIVEMAKASGLVLLTEKQRDPEKTTTFGTGQLISQALNNDIKRLIIGLGGSATCDGGIGAAAALGYRFLDSRGKELIPIGENLMHIVAIDTDNVDERIFKVKVEAVCDVANPLTGKDGASYVYSPQKGADADQVKKLDDGLANLAAVVIKEFGVDVAGIPGSGAAGGLGAGVLAFFGGRLEKGIELVIDLVDLKKELVNADLVITGEGKIDRQTIFDKAPAGVAKAAKQAGVPCVAICGSVGGGIEDLHRIGLDAIFSLCRRPHSLEEAMHDGTLLLEQATEQVVRLFTAVNR